MAQDEIESAVSKAVAQAYEAWAVEHPSLAAVIDRTKLTHQTVESLRSSPQYQQAIEGYYQGLNELNLANQLLDLAVPILGRILGI